MTFVNLLDTEINQMYTDFRLITNERRVKNLKQYTTRHMLRTGIASRVTPNTTKVALCDYHLGRRMLNDTDFNYTLDETLGTTVSERIECKDCNDQIERGAKFLADNPNALDNLTK